MKHSKRIGIIICEDGANWGGERGLYQYIEGKFKDTEDKEDTVYVPFHAVSGDVPSKDEINQFDGFVISGSHYSVNDSYSWISKLVNFVKLLRELTNGPKLFGICFGHQLIAKALGGKVEKNTSGRFVWGTEQIEIDESLGKNGFFQKAFGESRECFKIMHSHGEWVSILPNGAVCCGRSSTCEHEVLAYGEKIISTQGHPELVTEATVKNILPRIKEKGLLSKEEEMIALNSLSDQDHRSLMKFVKIFLSS